MGEDDGDSAFKCAVVAYDDNGVAELALRRCDASVDAIDGMLFISMTDEGNADGNE